MLLGAGAWTLLGRRGAEGAPGDDHRVELELPRLSEDPAAIPVQVWVDHPMDPEHFIRTVSLRVDQDPIPAKGTLRFTPLSGRAWAAFPIRSGTGGALVVTAECTRHGRFSASRAFRVSDGGCGGGPDPHARAAPPAARLRLPGSVRPGEVVEVRVKVEHSTDPGLVFRDGRYVRVAPAFYITRMTATLDDQLVFEFEMTPAVSPNPVIRFPLRATRSGTLRVAFANNEGRRWEAVHPLRV
jgi:predicted secreted protein